MEPDGRVDRSQYQLTYGLSRRLGCQLSAKEVFRHRLTRMESDCARYQLIARATYLPKGYLVAAATYLRCATVSVGRLYDLSTLRSGSPSLGSDFASGCADTSRYREVTNDG